MAEGSSIEWTHHTFNPWWGCTKVSPACEHCYAETWAKRVGHKIWGKRKPRRFFADAHWRAPIKWNLEAERSGTRARVFCASMADVFEGRRDLDAPRVRLWGLIESTPWLDWLLLTKRPENVAGAVPWGSTWPSNVWLGTTLEDQKWADVRVPALIQLPAIVHFVSCEPLLGPLDLRRWLGHGGLRSTASDGIDWVIAGGESGGHARPMNPSWARALRDQCAEKGVPFHFKQWGQWRPIGDPPERGATEKLADGDVLVRLGKKEAGRMLDERTWDGFPETAPVLRSANTQRRLALVR